MAKKTQIVIAGVGLVSILLIFSLPKVLVKNNSANRDVPQEQSHTEPSTPGDSHEHKAELTADQQKVVEALKTELTKAEVIAEIAEKTGIEKSDVASTVEAFFTVVKNSMSNGENIYVRGFGSFINKKRARKVARNISKNTAIIIEEHYIPSFKPAKEFVAKVKATVTAEMIKE